MRLHPVTAYVPKAFIPIGSRYVTGYISDHPRYPDIRDIVTLFQTVAFFLN